MGVQVGGSGREMEQAQNKTRGGSRRFRGDWKERRFFACRLGKEGGRESTKYLAEHNPEHCAFVPKEATAASNRASNHLVLPLAPIIRRSAGAFLFHSLRARVRAAYPATRAPAWAPVCAAAGQCTPSL